jgi:hypothetical protein
VIPTSLRIFAFTVLLPFFLVTLFIGGKRPGMDPWMVTTLLYIVWPLAIVLSIVAIDYFSFAAYELENTLRQGHLLVYFLFILVEFFGGACCLGLGLSLLIEFSDRPLYILNQLIGLVILDAGIVLLLRSLFGLRFLMRRWTSHSETG